jgi:superfamily I DNA/RNA helicase
MRRIEVVNLDKWVSDFLRRNGYRHEIDYGKRSGALWEKAMSMAPTDSSLPSSFYREEWERVVQPQGITGLDQYLKVSRVGRGVRLSRKDRQSVWPVFEEYRLLLNEHALREVDDAMRDARLLLEGKQSTLPYQSVIVDEAQDMGAQAFRLVRTMVADGDRKNDIFIVGDGHQRIYRHKVVLSQCGINIRGRSRKLRINYRTTEETRRWAVGLLEGVSVDDLDGGKDDQKAYKSLLRGVDPEVKCLDSFAEEVDFITEYLKRMESQGGSPKETCLVARNNNLLKQYESSLSEKGLKTYRVRRSEPEDRSEPGLRMATMHRVKGLEFDRVIIAGVNDGIIPYRGAGSESSDPVVQREAEWQERALLYVAATRARQDVLVTSFGKPSIFLAELK